MAHHLDKFKKGKLLSPGRVMTPWFRGAFMSVFHPESPMDGSSGEPKYQVMMLFDEKHVDISELKNLVDLVGREKFGARWEKISKDPSFKNPFRDGDLVEWEGFAGMKFAKASSNYAPGIIDSSRVTISDGDVPGAYSGAYYRATIGAYAYDNASRGVSFQLNNLQKLSDGEPFGGSRVEAEDEFDAFDSPVDDLDF